MDVAIVVIYLLGMIAFGFWGKRRATTQSDFLVAGRRLGPLLYSGTMAAIVLGGASTIGGVGLGYKYGISGMWLVVAIGVGILALSLLFAGRIQRLRVYTVSQMLELRYGPGSSVLSGVVMWGYTLMLSVTSTIAYATIFGALFDIGKVPAIILGGSKHAPVRRQSTWEVRLFPQGELAKFFAGRKLPKNHRMVVSAGDQGFAIRQKAEVIDPAFLQIGRAHV